MKTSGDCCSPHEYNVARLEVIRRENGEKNMTCRQPSPDECLMRKVNKIRKVYCRRPSVGRTDGHDIRPSFIQGRFKFHVTHILVV